MGGRADSGLERRHHARHRTEVTFWLLTNDGTSLLVKSINVSVGGALLRLWDSKELPAVGAQLRLTVVTASGSTVVPDDTKCAEVVRATPDGIAIRFLDS